MYAGRGPFTLSNALFPSVGAFHFMSDTVFIIVSFATGKMR